MNPRALHLVACSIAYHQQLRSSPKAWSRLVLVGYGEGPEEGEWLQYRDCPCGSSIAVTFRPDLDALAAIRKMDLPPVRLARMMFDGSREAGIVFCERYPANGRRS